MIEMDDREIKAATLELLATKGRWGAHYFPIDTLVHWIGKKVQKDGKRVKACLKELAREGCILVHKRGETVSLNPAMIQRINELIEKSPSSAKNAG